MRDCEKCGLAETAVTPGIGLDAQDDCEVLFVGEAPGAKEDDKGLPFQGKSGTLFRNAIRECGIGRAGFINIVQCRPPENRNPSPKEIKCCSVDFYGDITHLHKLRLIVASGNIALRGLLGCQGITKLSGKLLDQKYHDIPVMGLFHPAYILRSPQETKKWLEHIGRVKQFLDGTLVHDDDYGAYSLITTIDELEELYKDIRRVGYFAYDIETSGNKIFQDNHHIKCVGFSLRPRTAVVIPLGIPYWETGEELDAVREFLKKVFTARRIGKIGHNIKFDNLFMRDKLGILVRGTIWDTMISQYVLNETEAQGLKELAWKHTKLGGYENKLTLPVQDAEGEELYRYNAIDCDITHRVYEIHKKEIEANPGFHKLMETLLIPVNDVIADMEYNGMLINPDRVDVAADKVVEVREEIVEKLKQEACVREFEQATEEEFNPNSHLQLREILFRHAGLQPIKFTDKTKQPSTDKEVLDELAKQGSHTCELLIEYANYNSLEKFTKALKEYADVNNVIHTQYRLTRASSGRTSSSDPNLQNIPNKSKDLVGLRKCFVARDNFILAELDFNQHELRVMAEVAKDTVLRDALLSGDVHLSTTSVLLGKPKEQITPDERTRVGKTFNFGLIYGMTEYGLQRRLGCTEKESQVFLKKFFANYRGVAKYMDYTREFVLKNEYVETLTGRRRRFVIPPKPTGMKGNKEYERAMWEYDKQVAEIVRQALNMPIQGTAGDILLYSLIGIAKYLEGKTSFLSWEVHDSLGLQVHKDEVAILPEVQEIMKTYFLKYIPFEIPLAVDIKVGEDWGSMEEWKS